jgi:hypothetical protein
VGGPQSHFGCSGEEKNFQSPARNQFGEDRRMILKYTLRKIGIM